MPLGLLRHPLTRSLDVDAPETTRLRQSIIREKGLLRRLYLEWYGFLAGNLPPGPGAVLELGSGAGFCKEVVPQAIASDVFATPGVDAVLDARRLPFANRSLRAIAMVDVLHHIPDVEAFFAEAQRCLRPGGAVVMIEPWRSTWSRLIYSRLHPEPFDCDADWSLPDGGPLSTANGALPWIVLHRDRQKFETRFPGLRIQLVQPDHPFIYLASGGISMRSLAPGCSYGLLRGLERCLGSAMSQLAMFARIVVRREPV